MHALANNPKEYLEQPAARETARRGAAARMNVVAAGAFAALPLVSIAACWALPGMPAWLFMWALAVATFAACKGLTLLHARATMTNLSRGRQLAYLFAWPGMDAPAFLSRERFASAPRWWAYAVTLLKITIGVALVWLVSRGVLAQNELLATWLAMIGVMFMLHFGFLDLLSLLWRSAGVHAEPLMKAPALATSLAEFWGRRWNTGFHVLVEQHIFHPIRRHIGANAALLAGFLASGLGHDAVVSLPARAGYGLPTLYFLLQPLGIALQRSTLGRKFGLNRGVLGWFTTMLFVAVPIRLLFHDAFVLRVMLPFFRAIGAL